MVISSNIRGFHLYEFRIGQTHRINRIPPITGKWDGIGKLRQNGVGSNLTCCQVKEYLPLRMSRDTKKQKECYTTPK